MSDRTKRTAGGCIFRRRTLYIHFIVPWREKNHIAHVIHLPLQIQIGQQHSTIQKQSQTNANKTEIKITLWLLLWQVSFPVDNWTCHSDSLDKIVCLVWVVLKCIPNCLLHWLIFLNNHQLHSSRFLGDVTNFC